MQFFALFDPILLCTENNVVIINRDIITRFCKCVLALVQQRSTINQGDFDVSNGKNATNP